MNVSIRRLLAAVTLIATIVPAQAEEIFIAGVRPYERPAGAPRIADQPRARTWYVAALTGLTPPYPRSLFFLDVQGNWYTPFTVAGMPGPYDIRGWHKSK